MTRKIYEKQWNGDNALVVPTAPSLTYPDPGCFELDFPWAMNIRKVVIKQSGGTDKAFTLELFNKPVWDDGDEDLDLVMPKMSVNTSAVGTVFAATEGVVGWQFKNETGTETLKVRKIYARIVVTGQANECEFDLAIGGELTVAC